MKNAFINIKEKLEKYGQEHLLDFYNELTDLEKENLLNQLDNIDFELLSDLYESTKQAEEFKDDIIEPMPYVDKEKLSDEERKKYEDIGINAIKQGKLACLIMAGGQRYKTGT